MKFCDESDSVVEWSSEEIIVPYFSPLDQKMHRYFVDFWVKLRHKDGSIKCKLIEIKPNKQTKEPTKPTRVTRRYLNEVKSWVVNSSKWTAAEAFCKDKDWEFVILTEKELFK